ncbi:MAG: hypothetical protein R3D67_16130 [Hyphomicrobiaceae bacterium]
MPDQGGNSMPKRGDADFTSRLIRFAVVDSVVILFVLLPVLLWLFVFDTSLSQGEQTRYAIGIAAFYILVSGFLLWKFRILSGPLTDKKDAR